MAEVNMNEVKSQGGGGVKSVKEAKDPRNKLLISTMWGYQVLCLYKELEIKLISTLKVTL